MKTKNLLSIISIIEMFLLVIMGVLGNKLADLLDINPTLLFLLSGIIIIILVILTIYKTDPNEFYNPKPRPPSIRITKNAINSVIKALLYYPSALFLSAGAFQLSWMLEDDWLRIAGGSIVSGTILLSPFFLKYLGSNMKSKLPIIIGFILAAMYGTAGMYLIYFPDTFNSHLLIFALISAFTLTGLKYTYLYTFLETSFRPWYEKLPEK